MSCPAAVIYILRHVVHIFSRVHTHSTWSHAVSQTSWQRIILPDIRGSNSDQQVNRHWQQPIPRVNLATLQCINLQQNFPWGTQSERPLNRVQAVQTRALDELAWDKGKVTFFTHDSRVFFLFFLLEWQHPVLSVGCVPDCGSTTLSRGRWLNTTCLGEIHVGRKYDPESSSSIKKFPTT